jgi:hypothetical protein
MTPEPFNALDMTNLAHSIVTQMVEPAPTELGAVPRFTGAGLYAIYYTGSFSAYSAVSDRNRDNVFAEPIYVGKAIRAGGRSSVGEGTRPRTTALYARIGQHANSIRAARNLDINDFWVRWLVVEEIWIPLGESAMIRRHRPAWNAIVDGFGNHDPGTGRKAEILSRWDTLHPGRGWAQQFAARTETPAQIEQDVVEYLRSRLA